MINDRIRQSWVEVHLPTLWKNLESMQFKHKAPFLCPMVKANAYGHGAIEVVQFLITKGVNTFGFALFEEAQEVAKALPSKHNRYLVFSPFHQSVLPLIYNFPIEPVIGSLQELTELLHHASDKVKVHLKINLGMNRLGIAPAELPIAISQIAQSSHVDLQGLCSHLPNYEDFFDSNSSSKLQQEQFVKIIKEFRPAESHLLNSAGLIAAQFESNEELLGARPGISMYGCGPAFASDIQGQIQVPLEAPLKLKTKVCLIHNILKGEGVSYGPIWRATKDSHIGVLPIGYADGIRRCFSGKVRVEVRGKKVPIVGTVCMDYCMIDLTEVPGAQVGDVVTIINSSKDIEDMAKAAGTISYEILTGLSPRLPRVYFEK